MKPEARRFLSYLRARFIVKGTGGQAMGDDALKANESTSDGSDFSVRRDSDALTREAAKRADERVLITDGQRKALGTK